ncbi:MAG: hypothetical protein AAGE52_12980 [Myxococcota bacterium]
MATLPPTCLGCGRDHPRGGGCGYARDFTWTPYSTRERLAHLRFAPVAIGAVSLATLLYLLSHPLEGAAQTASLVILGVVFALFGVFGTFDFIREVRKKRFRGASADGLDRGLIVVVGGKVAYGFGETLRYTRTPVEAWAAPLRGAAVFAKITTLEPLIGEEFRIFLRESVGDESLLRGETRDAQLLAAAAAVIGLAARGTIDLERGKFVPWTRGKGKMKKVTEGTEYAARVVNADAEEEGFETRLLEAISAEPRLDAMLPAAVRDARFDDAGDPDPGLEEAWRRLLAETPDMLTLLLEHAVERVETEAA